MPRLPLLVQEPVWVHGVRQGGGPKREKTMTELEKAKADMERFQRERNYFGYKQSKKRYERLLRKEKRLWNLNRRSA